MSKSVDKLAQPVADELAELKVRIKEAIVSRHEILGPISRSLIELRGKMMRPILGLLSAKLNGQVNDKVYATAILFELLHHATLVHDDVIDEAYLRRGQATLGAMLRSRSAVLVGDFLFAKGLTAASKVGAFAQIEIATRSIESVVEGELAQSENSRRCSLSLDGYLDVVRLKTSSLLAGVSESCALAAGADSAACEVMRELGDALGVAFQIQDDILDYVGSADTGKALYNDIRERKITLPLLLAIQNAGSSKDVLSAMRKGRIEVVARFVELNGGVQASRTMMSSHYDRAMEILSLYPASDVRHSLEHYASYVTSRTK